MTSSPPKPWILRLASAISVLAHPAVLMLASVLLTPGAPERSPQQTTATWSLALLPICLGLLFAFWKVRRGRWQHVDASVPAERAELNRFMLPVLLVAAIVSEFWLDLHALALGLATSSLILATALLLAKQVKLSLHVSFAVLSAAVLCSDVSTMLIAALVLAAVIWSRLTLKRHTWPDIIVGLLTGMAAGLLWRLLR